MEITGSLITGCPFFEDSRESGGRWERTLSTVDAVDGV